MVKTCRNLPSLYGVKLYQPAHSMV